LIIGTCDGANVSTACSTSSRSAANPT
jgi:starch phosphorylase